MNNFNNKGNLEKKLQEMRDVQNANNLQNSASNNIIESTRNKVKKIFAALGFVAAVGSVGYIATKIPDDDTKVETLAENPRAMDSSEVMENMVNSYAHFFLEMKGGQYFFMDREGKIIDGIFDLPKNWGNMTDAEKQNFRDSQRKKLGNKYGISTKERDMIIRATIEQETKVERSLGNMQTHVVGDKKNRNRKEYLEDAFQNLTKDKVIDELISQHITGLVAAESSFDNTSLSRDGAIGIMQLMPSIIASPVANPKRWPLEEVKTSYMHQVEIAKNLLRDDFIRMNKKHTKKIADAYFDGNTDDAKRHFMIWALINAYNVGEPDISTAITAFLKKYPNKKALERGMRVDYDGVMGDDVFVYFTQFAQQSKAIRNYGNESGKYVFQAQAMTRAFEAKNSGKSLENIDKYIPIHKRETSDYEKTLYEGILDTIFSDQEENLAKIEANEKKQEIHDTLSYEEKFNRFYTIKKPKNEEMLNGKYLSGKFGITTLPKRWQPIFNEYLEAFANDYDLKKAKTKHDFAHMPAFEIEPENFSYQMIGVGSKDGGEKLGQKNDADYARMHESGHQMIANIHTNLEKKLKSQGNLEDRYTPMLTITSIGRDQEYADKHIPNASKNSLHLYGIALDLRINGGMLADTKTGEKIKLGGNDAKIFERALTQVLEEMRANGEIFVITEGNPPHYHLVARVDTKNNAGWWSKIKNFFGMEEKKWVPSDKHFHNGLV